MTTEQAANANPDTEAVVEETQTPDLEQEVADLKDKLLRALADVENMRRQKDREVEDARRYGVTRLEGQGRIVAAGPPEEVLTPEVLQQVYEKDLVISEHGMVTVRDYHHH